MSVIYINGEFVDAAVASVPVTDVALLRGYAVFDFLRTYGGTPFQLRAHLQRLRTSASLIDLSCPWDIEELADIAIGTMRRNGHPETNIHIVLTGGDSDSGFIPRGEPRLIVRALPWAAPPGWWYEEGVHAVTTELHRHMPQAKTINYAPAISAQIRAGARNPKAVEAIYVADGLVSEGSRSNIFIFKDGRWVTPADGLLLGITRAEVIKLLQADGQLDLRDITLDEVYAADEAILTSTTKEVLPLVRMDDVTIGAGEPGEMTKKLMRQWREMTNTYAAAGVVV